MPNRMNGINRADLQHVGHVVDLLRQQGLQQLLRGDRGSAALGIEPEEGGIEPFQRLIS